MKENKNGLKNSKHPTEITLIVIIIVAKKKEITTPSLNNTFLME